MQMTPGVSRTRQERAASVAAESATFVEPSSLLPSSEYRFHVEGPFDRGGITRRKKNRPHSPTKRAENKIQAQICKRWYFRNNL